MKAIDVKFGSVSTLCIAFRGEASLSVLLVKTFYDDIVAVSLECALGRCHCEIAA